MRNWREKGGEGKGILSVEKKRREKEKEDNLLETMLTLIWKMYTRGGGWRRNLQFPYNLITLTFQSYFRCFEISYHSFLKIAPSTPGFYLKSNGKISWQSPTVATCASTRAQVLLISRGTCRNIREKNLSIANNVATHAQKLVTSGDTCWFIQGKILLVVHNVSTPAKMLGTSGNTCWHTLGKEASVAHNVTTPAVVLTPLGYTSGLIQGRNHSSVTSVTIPAAGLSNWKCTSALTLEKNPTPAINAASQARNPTIFSGTYWRSTERNQMCKKTACLSIMTFSFFCLLSDGRLLLIILVLFHLHG